MLVDCDDGITRNFERVAKTAPKIYFECSICKEIILYELEMVFVEELEEHRCPLPLALK